MLRLCICVHFFSFCAYMYLSFCLLTFSNLSSLWLVAVGSDKEGHSHNSVWWVKYTLFILVSAPWRIYMPQHWLNVYCFEFAARENWHCVDELLDTSGKKCLQPGNFKVNTLKSHVSEASTASTEYKLMGKKWKKENAYRFLSWIHQNIRKMASETLNSKTAQRH